MNLTRKQLAASCIAGATLIFTSALASAAPPPHAPAHGWRAKHDPYYLGYTGKQWGSDYGIIGGRCDRAGVTAALGGVLGAAAGSQIGSGSGRTIAILTGTVLGSILGAEIGRHLDRSDEACIAHGLELAPDHQHVRWSGANGMNYTLTPLGPYNNGSDCRLFSLGINGHGDSRGVGCRRGDGAWELRGL